MAARTRRLVPSSLTGLMPMLEDSGKRIFFTPISRCRKSMTLATSGVPGLPLDAGVDVLGVLPEDHHVHELRACFTGEGTPGYQRTGRRQT